jgi:hypothetical protein
MEQQQNQQTLFNYDDEETVTEETEEELTWRLDPSVSLSDWIINVFNTETRLPQAYYVHKNTLAVGPRKSEYFVRYFLSHDNVNSNKKSTDIWLERVAADCMPQFLDYVYSTEGKVEVSTASAVGLRHLAQYFGNRKLHHQIMQFVRDDLSMENVLTYYQDALTVDDEKVTELTAQKVSENIMQVEPNTKLLSYIDPSFLRRIMGSNHIDTDEKKYHTSLLLAEYCLINKKHLDDQDFTRLTSERILPLVHYNAALTLLEMEADLVISNDDDAAISSLQERCIKDLSDHWQELSEMKQADVLHVLRKLSSVVVGDMLMKSMSKAKSALASATGGKGAVSQMQASKAKVAELHASKAEESKIAELESKHKAEMAKLKEEFEQSLLKLRDVALEKDNTLKREFTRFQRLPNEPGGRLMQSGEQQQPDEMPPLGDYTTEGLVLSKPKGGGKYAVFFYNYRAAVDGSGSTGVDEDLKGRKANGGKRILSARNLKLSQKK